MPYHPLISKASFSSVLEYPELINFKKYVPLVDTPQFLYASYILGTNNLAGNKI